jgi:Flp pilus assembly pilin Flp
LKGGFQFTAATVDKALGSDMGATDLVVAVLLVALAVMIIAYIARGKRAIESVF